MMVFVAVYITHVACVLSKTSVKIRIKLGTGGFIDCGFDKGRHWALGRIKEENLGLRFEV